MKYISIMYHDVVDSGDWNASGFATPDAALYKLDRLRFNEHLTAIAGSIDAAPVSVLNVPTERKVTAQPPLLLTFDDGGASSMHIADQLERRGWLGHFFITSGWIGAPRFISASAIRKLHERGHVIGSHSHSHPTRVSLLSWEAKLNEWDRSVKILSDIIGEPIRVASVPGGHFSTEVAETASIAGIEVLFTSEPTSRIGRVKNCFVFGRYGVQRWTTPEVVAAIASGRLAPRLRQLAYWNAKKAAKTIGGGQYLKLRASLARGIASRSIEATTTDLKERG